MLWWCCTMTADHDEGLQTELNDHQSATPAPLAMLMLSRCIHACTGTGTVMPTDKNDKATGQLASWQLQ
jgi:hypothetical protein